MKKWKCPNTFDVTHSGSSNTVLYKILLTESAPEAEDLKYNSYVNVIRKEAC